MQDIIPLLDIDEKCSIKTDQSWRRQWHPTPVLLPGKSHGWRSLVGCSPWSRWIGHDWATSLSLFTFTHWRRKWQPTPVFLPGESQGRGSLVGCRLWDHTESDMTEVTQQQQRRMLSHWEKICLLLSYPTFGSFYPVGFYCGHRGTGQPGFLLCWFWVSFHQPGLDRDSKYILETNQRP